MIQEANLHWRYIDTDSNLLLPWYTKPALEWLKKQDVSQWNVFEYGSGYSTVWWRRYANNVDSIESDLGWAIAMGREVHRESEKNYYVSDILHRQFKEYDCIIVDGEWREECVQFSRDYLKPGGFMIVDNYGQTDFPPTDKIDSLLEGWGKQVFKQPNHSDWATAIFTKP